MVKTVVITGCSTGFGRAAALHLAGHGWQVFATVRKPGDAEALQAAAQALPQPALANGVGGSVTPVLCDITRTAEVAALRAHVEAHVPHLDALVNNAGTSFPGPLELLPLDELRAQLEINVVAHLGVTQAFLPLLKLGRGRIVNVSSISGRVVFPVNGAYSMSKFALEAMTDALRLELAPFGVRVVSILPGSSATAIWETSLARGTSSPGYQRLGPYAPLAERVRQAALESARTGFPPQRLANLLLRILTSPRPRTRYVLPLSAAFLLRLRHWLPDWAWDWGLRRALHW